MTNDNIEKFIAALTDALDNRTFVRMTLGNYRGSDEHLQKIIVRLIELKKGVRLSVLYRHHLRDTVKNFEFADGVERIRALLGVEFFSGHLFTTQNDYQLEISKKGKSRLNIAKPTFKKPPPTAHDRQKRIQIDPDRFYLRALGITTDSGQVRDKQQDKWRQINRFIEILSKLFDNSPLKDKRSLKIADMGSGKGYLTFAAYDYFKHTRGVDVEITGIDARVELVGLCNDLAKACEFEKLHFVEDRIEDYELPETDILIALHACNTATDEAIYKGIRASAGLIVCSPCCHQEVRPQIKPPHLLRDILKHGIMLDREAEMITDGIRALLLEQSGYATKVFEFISTEHTAKNNMIVGTKNGSRQNADNLKQQIDEIKNFYGIDQQRLETLLADSH